MKLEIGAKYNGRTYNSANAALSDLRKQNQERTKDLQELGIPLKKASIYLDRWVQSNFKTEGGKVGGWEPFALGGRLQVKQDKRFTKNVKKGAKKTLDTSAKLLQDTGRLRASFLPFYTKQTAGIGSDLDYAEKHHEGFGIPKRRLLPEQKDIIDDVRKIMEGFVVEAIKVKK